MIMGADKGNRKAVSIYDQITKNFADGDNMNIDRAFSACTIFKSPKL